MRPVALLPLAFALSPGLALAQDGPSYDCRDSDTRTEIAICASPELSQLEMQMFAAYQGLVGRIGEREARRMADELLLRRQACEGDPSCIAERLIISMEVFDQRGRSSTAVAELEPTLPLTEGDGQTPTLAPAAPVEIVPEAAAPEEDVAALAVPTEDAIPLAAQAPWPPESAPIPPVRDDTAEAAPLEEEAVVADAAPVEEIVPPPEPAEAPVIAAAPAEEPVIAPEEETEVAAAPELSAPDTPGLTETIDGAELASSDGGGEASFDTPISWAFMDLSREDRAALQSRLQEAGLYGGPVEGSWNNDTRSALETAAAGTEGFDLTNQNSAALLLDYITSDAFAGAQGEAPIDDSQF